MLSVPPFTWSIPLGSCGQQLFECCKHSSQLGDISHSLTFTLSCQGKKQDEDTGPVYVFVCAGCVFVLLCAASHAHVCVPCGCLCAHIGNTRSAPLLTGPGSLELQQPPCCQAATKGNKKTFLGLFHLGSFKQELQQCSGE